MLRTLFTFQTNMKNVRHLVGLACTTWTGVSREPDYYIDDTLYSTLTYLLTYLLHYDVLRLVIAKDSRPSTIQ